VKLEPVMLRLFLVVLVLVALLAAGCGEKRLQLPEDSLGGGDSIDFPDGFPSGGDVQIKVVGPNGCSFAVERVEIFGRGPAYPPEWVVAEVTVAQQDFESTNPC
jgi:hypothetical protein